LTSATEVIAWSTPSMGGALNVTVCAEPERRAEATAAARRVAQRVESWAARLTRFEQASDLCALNAARESLVGIRPTLAAALDWAHLAGQRSGGIVDATLLAERIAAQTGCETQHAAGSQHCWRVETGGRNAHVQREPGLRFDLDGVAKGWIADRATDLLIGWPSASVDADGDVCLQLGPGQEWLVDVGDPRVGRGADGVPLATLRLRGGETWGAAYGVATSGTSVHRWQLVDGRTTHHLIDPRTGSPAETDVVQATVVGPTAREAEMLAKSAVILGSESALGFLSRSAALTAILLLESGEVVAMPEVEKWLA
jgi:thiamine biosynthesis lipoprotein